MDLPDHIAAHPQVIVRHEHGWWTHWHSHHHDDDTPVGLQHDGSFDHAHEHRWQPRPHHHHDLDAEPGQLLDDHIAS